MNREIVPLVRELCMLMESFGNPISPVLSDRAVSDLNIEQLVSKELMPTVHNLIDQVNLSFGSHVVHSIGQRAPTRAELAHWVNRILLPKLQMARTAVISEG
jgi:predicted HAD superfamily Cof-like phosphohydrolase